MKYFQIYHFNGIVFVLQANKDNKPLSKQDRRAEQLLKKVTRDVQKLKRNSPNSNALSFRWIRYVFIKTTKNNILCPGM